MAEIKKKIFLSYVYKDISMASKIYKDLNNHGLDVWFDKVSLLDTQCKHEQIEQALQKSDFFVGLISSACIRHYRGLGSVTVGLPGLGFVSHYPGRIVQPLIIKLDNCSMPYSELLGRNEINIFSESEYQQGIKEILNIINPSGLVLRSAPNFILDPNKIITNLGLAMRNQGFPDGLGFSHQYELKIISCEKVIIDNSTQLMWQQSGSLNIMKHSAAEQWMEDLNRGSYVGFCDWRLPTIEEAISLMLYKTIKANLYINPIFDSKQCRIWTCDRCDKTAMCAWAVDFRKHLCVSAGCCGGEYAYIRAVRSV